MACGQLRLSPSEFWNITPRELHNAIRGHAEAEGLKQQSDWERTRWQTVALINIQLPKGKSVKAQDLALFPWEKKEKKNTLSQEQAKEILEKWQRKAIRA